MPVVSNNGVISLEREYGAHNYLPLPVVLSKGAGIYVWDLQGKRYIDMMSAYSAVSHGHCHPKLVAALTAQAQKLAVVSRAFYTETLGAFLQQACEMTGCEKALPMNSGAEGVETAIKASRKWGHLVKGIPENKAEIIVCEGNFHGRTTTIVSCSTEPQYRYGFGPFTPGFTVIPYNDATALEEAITPNTAAFLLEPIQGEAGIRIPSSGYLRRCRELCNQHNVLLICDEIQTGLGRTGKLLASQHEEVRPDGIILGKALGGGLLPVSLFLTRKEVMDIFTPGDHGSTFGGNQLAAMVGLTALKLIEEENLVENSAILGNYLLEKLQTISNPIIKEVRGKGLFIGIEIESDKVTARQICLSLMEAGLLSKETHGTVIRLAPPLVIKKSEVDDAFEIIAKVFQQF
ncbi:MAG: ornithine--oxo-acid transaminase [Gammaproteobacteria bacterium]|nr:ornithine--oxo-acid transaminase [Gammaproteobacteria bacterium]